jgi:hypothetical protein
MSAVTLPTREGGVNHQSLEERATAEYRAELEKTDKRDRDLRDAVVRTGWELLRQNARRFLKATDVVYLEAHPFYSAKAGKWYCRFSLVVDQVPMIGHCNGRFSLPLDCHGCGMHYETEQLLSLAVLGSYLEEERHLCPTCEEPGEKSEPLL